MGLYPQDLKGSITTRMAHISIVTKFAEISETENWRFIRTLMEKELEKATDIDNLKGEGQLEGAKFAKKVILKVINQIDGAKNTLDING